MFLIIPRIIILVVSFSIRSLPHIQRLAQIRRIIGIVFIVLGVVTSAFVQIDAGPVGVKKIVWQRSAFGAHKWIALCKSYA